MASARMVYGDDLDWLFGTLAPTPAERIEAVEETGRVDLGGGRRLDSHYSPGHAKHHVGLLDSVSGDLYVGDAAGMYLPETGDLRAGTPPPDFDLDTALNSVALFGALRPERLLFSHYGPVGDVQETLERSAEELKVWVDETRRAHREGMDLDHVVALVHERTRERYAGLRPGGDEYAGEKLTRLASTEANVAGIMQWLEKDGR
jgi:glyoxylase-like metal-dependent hydrolase (beta-lactamase superfamily II)